MRQRAIEEVGGVDPNLVFFDLDLFIRLAARYPIAFVHEPTVEYRIRPDGMHRDFEAMLRWRLDLIEKHLGPEWTPAKRAAAAEAYSKAAYRQLWPSPTPASVRHARRNLIRALRLHPKAFLTRLRLAMLAAALVGRPFAFVIRHFAPRLTYSDAKLTLQRVFRVGRGRPAQGTCVPDTGALVEDLTPSARTHESEVATPSAQR